LLEAAAGHPVEIIEAGVKGIGSNVTNQQFEVALARVTTLGSPSGTSVTPNPEEKGDQAAATTALANLTAEPTTYGPNVDHDGSTSLGGWQFQPAPETRPMIESGGSMGLRMLATLTSNDLVVWAKLREMA
jgi:hypothetical protein